MASVEQRVRAINERRMRAWSGAKRVLDDALRNGGDGLTGEQQRAYDMHSAELDKCDREREELLRSEEAREEVERVNEAFNSISTRSERFEQDRRKELTRQFFSGDRNVPAITVDLQNASYMSDALRAGMTPTEYRVLQTDGGASGGSLTLPTVVEANVWSYFVSSNAMRRLPCTVVTRNDGAPYVVPRVATHGIATQVASQTTAFAGSDPVLSSVVLSAYGFGQLTYVANDMIEDSGVDVLGYVSQEIGGAIGRLTSTAYITGTGSGQPNGVMTAVNGSGTIATGGFTTDPTFEKMVDLMVSVPNQYRQRGKCAWLMHDLTAGVLRKLRDGAGGTVGAFVWQPSQTVGMSGGAPDTIFNFPVEVDSNCASLASAAKVIAFGDWSSYWIRDVQGMRIERSTDLAFASNQTAFRGLLRTDGNLVDTQGPAINVMRRGT